MDIQHAKKELIEFSENQRISFINLLIVATSQNNNVNIDKRNDYLIPFYSICNVYADTCHYYFKKYGLNRLNEDLNELALSQKDFLIEAFFDIINYTKADFTDEDTQLSFYLFGNIGISRDYVSNFVIKNALLENNINTAIDIAKNIRISFLKREYNQSISLMQELYEFIRINGCEILLEMPPINCQVVGLAFASMALVFKNGDNDFNSVAAENAFYCLAKSYLEAQNTFTLPAIFTLLNMSSELLDSKFCYALDSSLNIANDLQINNKYFFKLFYNPYDLCKYYLLDIFYDIENQKFKIPEDLPYLLPAKDDITKYLMCVEEAIGEDKLEYLFAGKLIFNCVYNEIKETLMKF